jgi:hypothetical protein
MATRTRQQDPADIDTSTPEGRKAWKENASSVLNQAATRRRLCDTYDQKVVEFGLLPRQNYLDNLKANADYAVNRYERNPFVKVEVVDPEVRVEDTEEEFNAWRIATARELLKLADEAGIETANDAIARAGFPSRSERQVVVNGTFTVPLTVKVFEGEDIIDGVNRQVIANKVHNALYYDEEYRQRYLPDDTGVEIDWKATVAESD